MESSRMVLPTRLQVKGWARVGPSGAHTLRRGAWYPVVRISSSNIVVLDVNRHNVPVDRRFLEIRYHPPERWTIVRCEPRVIERLGRIFPLTYAVCPRVIVVIRQPEWRGTSCRKNDNADLQRRGP